MNAARTIAEWLKDKKTWKMLAAAAVLGIMLTGIVYVTSENKKGSKDPTFEIQTPKIQETKFEQNVHSFAVTKDGKDAKKNSEEPLIIEKPKQARMKPVLNIDTIPEKLDSNEPELSPVFAPYGRLIKCELIITIDSGNAVNPIIALVTENVWHQGQLVIPAGVEVHGMAQNTPLREKINAQNNWTLVWRTRDGDNGKELQLKGIALEYSKDTNTNQWPITDGAAGIPGYVIKGSDVKELVAIMSTFASGVAAGLVQSETTTTSSATVTSYDGDTKSAIALGAQKAMELYTQRLLRKIAQDGYFVRCPAGTEFYLYVTQVINMNDAKAAGTLFNESRKQQDVSNMLKNGRAVLNNSSSGSSTASSGAVLPVMAK